MKERKVHPTGGAFGNRKGKNKQKQEHKTKNKTRQDQPYDAISFLFKKKVH